MDILAIGTDRLISKKVLDNSQFKVTNKLKDGVYDVLYVDMLHIGMDVEFEPVVDRLEEGRIQVAKIVFLATAGMDNEIAPTWIGESDVKELMLEVKYVAKLIDETELPYTILRPVEVHNELQNNVEIVPEGQSIKQATVSAKALKKVIEDAIFTDQYLNQSIGITSQS